MNWIVDSAFETNLLISQYFLKNLTHAMLLDYGVSIWNREIVIVYNFGISHHVQNALGWFEIVLSNQEMKNVCGGSGEIK